MSQEPKEKQKQRAQKLSVRKSILVVTIISSNMGSSNSASSGYVPPEHKNTVYTTEYLGSLPSMKGKVVCITGCTTGLGYVCAKTMAEKGAKVVMLNRKSDRATKAETTLKEQVPGADISSVDCDLMSFESVKKAVVEVRSKLADTGLDVLCNNAGVMALADQASALVLAT